MKRRKTQRLLIMFLSLLLSFPVCTFAFTSSDLQTEIVTDPASLGCYAGNVTTGNDSAIAACINLVRAGAGYVVSKGVVKRDDFLGTWSDVLDGIPNISDATKKAKWTWRVEKLLIPKDTIDYGSSLASGFFAEMVSDGLTGAGGTLTNDDVTARTTRQGSRAEVLWGPGTVITLRDISLALRNSQ